MALSVAGTDSFAAAKTSGAQSTSRTVPTHTGIALISFHYFVGDTSDVSSVVLGGVTATKIATVADAGHNHTSTWWVAGVSSGTQTLAWANGNAFSTHAITLIYLDGSETVTAIRASSTDFDTNGASGVTGLSFVAGDWTMIAYTSDLTGVYDGTAHGNTAAIAEATLDTLVVGVSYRTDTGTIDVDSATNSYTGIVGFVVKAAGGGVVNTTITPYVMIAGT